MLRKIVFALMIVAEAGSAFAAWDVGAGLENYQWMEYPENFSGRPKESGVRSALFVNWSLEREQGASFTWRGKIYSGTVNYDTYIISTGAPVTTKTDYFGMASEVQVYGRYDLGNFKLDTLGGIGLDSWRRSIRNGAADQIEDYSIYYARMGLRLAKPRSGRGFHGEAGVKFPFHTRENAHLTDQGFTTNPSLSPKGALSGYAEFGYRINAMFDVVGYYDSWRFKRSDNVIVSTPGGLSYLVWQPKSNMDTLGVKLLVSF